MSSKPNPTLSTNSGKRLQLSLILCSRNDQYMGNSRWRLETAINYAAKKVHELGRQNEVEIVVADWGSKSPLSEALALSSEAAAMVSFVEVPHDLALELQQDSPFAEVLALNVAARRSNGAFIGRIDQDTLVGKNFLKFFFDLAEGKQSMVIPVEKALMFSNQRMVPYRFTSRSPSFQVVERFVSQFGKSLTMEHRSPTSDFYTAGVGIWLIHRDLWFDCEGYDERMIYMNAMETNMVRRLLLKYELVNLGKLINYDFYHLEHYHPQVVRRSSTYRKCNPRFPYSEPTELRPNGTNWGLANFNLTISSSSSTGPSIQAAKNPKATLMYPFVLLRFASAWLLDSLRVVYMRWQRRCGILVDTVGKKPILQWPALLKERLNQRKIAQKSQYMR